MWKILGIKQIFGIWKGLSQEEGIIKTRKMLAVNDLKKPGILEQH